MRGLLIEVDDTGVTGTVIKQRSDIGTGA